MPLRAVKHRRPQAESVVWPTAISGSWTTELRRLERLLARLESSAARRRGHSRPSPLTDARTHSRTPDRLRSLRYDDVTTDRRRSSVIDWCGARHRTVRRRHLSASCPSVDRSVGRYWMWLRQLAADVGLTRSPRPPLRRRTPNRAASIWSCHRRTAHHLPFQIVSLPHWARRTALVPRLGQSCSRSAVHLAHGNSLEARIVISVSHYPVYCHFVFCQYFIFELTT